MYVRVLLADEHPEKEQDNYDGEALEHEPAVRRDAGEVLEQFFVGAADAHGNIGCVGVDALHGVALLRDHV